MSETSLNKIEKLLKEQTGYKISKATGIGETTISRWVTGKTPLVKMSLENAMKLTKYAEELAMEKAKETLEKIKNTDVAFAVMNERGEVYCNRETGNIMDVYGLTDEAGGHFYGVYGDVVKGQIDSRSDTDETILGAIARMIELGTMVNREDLPKGEDFKRTYFWG